MISNCLSLKLSDIFLNYNEITGEFSLDENQKEINYADVCEEKFKLASIRANHQWHAAIASLEELLPSIIDINSKNQHQGLILSSPTSIIKDDTLSKYLKGGIFRVKTNATMALMPCCKAKIKEELETSSLMEFPMMVNDSIRDERFCLLFTAKFALVFLLGKDENGLPKFYFSFAPEVITRVWLLLKYRLLVTHNNQLSFLENSIQEFDYSAPDYRLVSKFSNLLANKIAQTINLENQNLSREEKEIPRKSKSISLKKTPLPPYPEVELLQALTHEIRTPLTTIKTITKLLLKRAKLTPDLVKHLEIIDQECTEQINRMELIFKAAELETKSVKEEQVRLVPTSLDQIFAQSIPCWKKQAKRRNVMLDIILPQKLPQIVSDPAMLTQILTGLMEKFTRNIPSGGQIKILISTAGNQLKLQFLPESNYENNKVKSLGQFLLLQPDTGSVSLNLDVTKNIFQALGGKLTVRQKPKQGEVLTIFLPLGTSPKWIKYLKTKQPQPLTKTSS